MTGTVSALHQRQQIVNYRSVWSFRVEPDGGGKVVPVEMRGYFFRGNLANGDRVRVEGRWVAGTLRTLRAHNLTTDSEVRVWSLVAAQAALMAAFVAIGIAVFLMFARGADEEQERSRREAVERQERFRRDAERQRRELERQFQEQFRGGGAGGGGP